MISVTFIIEPFIVWSGTEHFTAQHKTQNVIC